MTRITQAILAESVVELERMDTHAQLSLGDEIFARQPTLLGAVVVLRRFGASDAQIGIALHVLFVAWLAMKRCEVQKKLKWPVISEDVHDQCMKRLTARMRLAEGLPLGIQEQAVKQQSDEHKERYLLAFALGHLRGQGVLNIKSEAEKQVVLSTLGIVECITSSAPRIGR